MTPDGSAVPLKGDGRGLRAGFLPIMPSGEGRPRPPSAEWSTLPLLLTVPEVASLLRKTATAVYAMVERGQLPGVVRLDRRSLRFQRAALVAWLEGSAVPTPFDRR